MSSWNDTLNETFLSEENFDLNGTIEKRKQAKFTKEALIEQRKDDIKELLHMPAGRRFLHRILSECKVYSSTFTGNATTYYLEGKRDIGLWLMNEMALLDDEETIRFELIMRREALLQQKENREREKQK